MLRGMCTRTRGKLRAAHLFGAAAGKYLLRTAKQLSIYDRLVLSRVGFAPMHDFPDVGAITKNAA